jgi:uncharacterized repeat protein (TIGR03803 family)
LSAHAQTNLAILHSFRNSITDGSIPEGQLVLIGSTLYGLSFAGGSTSNGSVFQVSTNGTGVNLVYSFSGGTNGTAPCGSLVLGGSAFYGLTYHGGTNNSGVLFQMNTDGTDYTVLHVFRGGNTDGRFPNGSPTISGSAIYGMTGDGGTNDAGVVFKMDAGSTNLTVLHSFVGGIADGNYPNEGVVLGGATLYGTTYYGGSNDIGIAFSIDTSGNNFKILHHFMGATGDGGGPVGPLTLSGSALYGVSLYGGTHDNGVLFKVDTNGANYTILHDFAGGTNDGAYPQYGSLVVTDSVVYGATTYGGATDRGVVFQTTTNGAPFTILHSFLGGTNDGANPFYGPILSGSVLYGITDGGGTNNLGVVYALTGDLPPSPGNCTNVPGNASQGVTITNVVAGQTYAYSASGCASVNSALNAWDDPDGNEHSDSNCMNFTSRWIGSAGFTCPGIVSHSLVAKINGGPCIQLGSSGIFIAPTSGTLTLYLNDDIYTDNGGSWNVCITPTQQVWVCTTVPGTTPAGSTITNVIAGHAYMFQSSGSIAFNTDGCFSNPDGNMMTSLCAPVIAGPGVGFICEGIQSLSLVGKINGGPCIQLGSSGTFVASASGPLTLYYNDSNFGDNNGTFSACMTDLGPAPAPDFRITAINRAANNINITWNTTGGQTNAVQVTPGDGQGNYQTNNFTDLSGQIVIPGSGAATTNYTEVGGATNFPSRYYRIRVVP